MSENEVPLQRALDLVTRIENAPDIATLNAWFADVARDFGVISFGAILLGRPGEPVSPKVVATHSSRAWAAHYFANNYFAIDPTLIELRHRTSPFDWEGMERRYRSRSVQALFSDARSAGYHDGLDVPWHTADGMMGVVTLRGERLDTAPRAKPMLRLIATYYAEVARELSEAAEGVRSDDVMLSERQIECLTWAADGKSDWEIAHILGIAEGTVQRHFERIRARLNVATRTQAVVIALRAGWIVPSSRLNHTTRASEPKA